MTVEKTHLTDTELDQELKKVRNEMFILQKKIIGLEAHFLNNREEIAATSKLCSSKIDLWIEYSTEQQERFKKTFFQNLQKADKIIEEMKRSESNTPLTNSSK